jgi:hypothetical protein
VDNGILVAGILVMSWTIWGRSANEPSVRRQRFWRGLVALALIYVVAMLLGT